jgi:alpha-glucosidase (family GH31 glycosyl hydrolase)
MVKADIPWMVNHFNYVDNARRGQRPMLLSRRCGMGGHRYGVGFSGDTWATWEMLDFLPDFTSKASNVGFGWWSHDVGGFMNGIRDDEMMVRSYVPHVDFPA